MNINRHGIPVLLPHIRARRCFKVRHLDRDSAFDHLVEMEMKGGHDLNVYRCRWCKCFHVGHRREGKR